MYRCHSCGLEWVSEKKQPAVKESCEDCGAYLHCCLNCRFYDEHVHNKCAIPTTEWVGDRAGCNFCDEFTFADTRAKTRTGDKRAQARDAFTGLLEGKGAGDETAADDFDKLFGD